MSEELRSAYLLTTEHYLQLKLTEGGVHDFGNGVFALHILSPEANVFIQQEFIEGKGDARVVFDSQIRAVDIPHEDFGIGLIFLDRHRIVEGFDSIEDTIRPFIREISEDEEVSML